MRGMKRSDDQTALNHTQLPKKFRVTHPFHPLYKREFEIEGRWSYERRQYFVFYGDNGHKSMIPLSWTDAIEEQDVFVIISAGRSYFRVKDLLRLSELTKYLQS